MASNVSPIYIAEVSPAPWRGRMVAMNQMTIVIGILMAQIVNWWIAEAVPAGATAEAIRASWNGQYAWRWMFTAVAIPSVVFFVGALLLPESPRWLAVQGRTERARRILARIGGDEHAARELGAVTALAETHRGETRWRELLAPGVFPVIVTGVALAVLQQWCGINVIFNYAEEIYRNAGYGVSDILFNIVITGTINLVFTLLAFALVDRLGRRVLMLAGFASIAVCHTLLGLSYHLGLKGVPVLAGTLAAIACYATTLAPVTWVLISEIFPNRIRGSAVSVSVCALWIACFGVTFTFPILNRALGSAPTFWLYAAICSAGFVLIHRRVAETKGKSLEEIEAGYARGH
jgi:sugar porter (SP) family MFS transporter